MAHVPAGVRGSWECAAQQRGTVRNACTNTLRQGHDTFPLMRAPHLPRPCTRTQVYVGGEFVGGADITIREWRWGGGGTVLLAAQHTHA